MIIFLQTVFIFGLSLFLSSIHVFFRDLRYILDVILMAWFWLTPIAYPSTLIPESYLFLYKLNPMTLFVTAYRDVLTEWVVTDPQVLDGDPPCDLGFLGLGYLPFLRIRKRLAEEI